MVNVRVDTESRLLGFVERTSVVVLVARRVENIWLEEDAEARGRRGMMLFLCDWVKMWTDSRCHRFHPSSPMTLTRPSMWERIEASFWWSHPVPNSKARKPFRPQSTKAISAVVVICKQHIHIKVVQLQILIADIGVDTFILSSTNY